MKMYISSDNDIFGVENNQLVFIHRYYSYKKEYTMSVLDKTLIGKPYPFNVDDFKHYGLPKPNVISCFVIEYATKVLEEIKKGIHKPYVKPKPLPKYYITETIKKYGEIRETNIIPCVSLQDIKDTMNEYKKSFTKRCADKWYAIYSNNINDKTVEGKLDL